MLYFWCSFQNCPWSEMSTILDRFVIMIVLVVKHNLPVSQKPLSFQRDDYTPFPCLGNIIVAVVVAEAHSIECNNMNTKFTPSSESVQERSNSRDHCLA